MCKPNWEDLDKFGKILGLCVICTACVFLLLTIPYWIGISVVEEEDPDRPTKIALAVISALILIFLAFCGLFGAFKTHIFCLKQYGCMNIVMWIFTMALTVLQYVALTTCGDPEPLLQDTVFGGICENENDYLFWVPSLIVLFLTSCAAFSACGMCWKINRYKPDSGGFGEYFG